MQKVKLGYTQSGIAGFFTGGMLAVSLDSDAVREIKSDPNAAFAWANRFHFQFDGYHRSWQLTQETLNDVHETIVSLTTQYNSGLITPFELINAITGLKEGLGNLIHSDMAGLTCPNTGLKVNTMQRKPVDTGNDEEKIEALRADFALALDQRDKAEQEADSLRGALNTLHDTLHNAILS